ncbi:hypothetical protein PFMG_01512, partial [Plasmodium falciparum IGH-CR14]
ETNFVFSSLLRVLLSGLFLVNNVNLLDNIIGDILTSLSKTFSDVQYFLCFLLKGMKTKEPAKCPSPIFGFDIYTSKLNFSLFLCYWINLYIFRLTWAITIMPINIFENKEINSFLITFFLMFIEVLRRSIVPRLTKKKKF